ncbi:MAG TPA: M56 family metallopeptidase [Vicinamibacterales bacterium]
MTLFTMATWDPASAGLMNHLWQSTLFLAIVALLALALRNNRAQVRYWLWLAASLKFLVPFPALVAIGRRLPWPASATIPASPATAAIDAMSQPFSSLAPAAATAASPVTPVSGVFALPVVLLAIWFVGCVALLMTWLVRWRRVAVTVREATIVESGRELEILRRLENNVRAGLQTRPGLSLVVSGTSLEPGVFGILRPVLLWPRSISGRLSDEQIEAIFAHELAHIRRRDNLAAALHMLVQAMFWFHPLVWWVGARLIDERERACDDEVIRQGSQPQVYAESILKTCEFYVESPLVCVSGITGSDLKKRVEAIMAHRLARNLSPARKILLATAGIAAVVVPIGIGIVTAAGIHAQTKPETSPRFEVASIKPWKLVDNNSREARILAYGADPTNAQFNPTGTGRFAATAVTLKRLIAMAYVVQPSRVSGGPDWIGSDRYTIEAKAEEGVLLPGEVSVRFEQLRVMLRQLLADRFALRLRHEPKEFAVYALGVAKGGPRLQPADRDCFALSTGPGTCHSFIGGARAGLTGQSVDMADLAATLTLVADRPVIDGTGIKGLFDMNIGPWNPFVNGVPDGAGQGNGDGGGPIDFNTLPTIFTLLPEKFGLKLDATKAPLDTIVIDSAQRPSED